VDVPEPIKSKIPFLVIRTVLGENIPSCVEWCKYARECLGLKRYNRLMEEKKVYDKLIREKTKWG